MTTGEHVPQNTETGACLKEVNCPTCFTFWSVPFLAPRYWDKTCTFCGTSFKYDTHTGKIISWTGKIISWTGKIISWAEVEKEAPHQQKVESQDSTPSSAFNQQVAGNHYRELAIQPVEYIHRNKLGFCEGSVIKYVSRWRSKGGVQDLKKARHFIDLLIEMEEDNDNPKRQG